VPKAAAAGVPLAMLRTGRGGGIYLVGNDNSSAPSSISASFLENGDLAPFGWSDTFEHENMGRWGSALVVVGPRLLVLGGVTGGTLPNTPEYALIDRGYPRQFSYLPAWPTESTAFSAVVLGDWMYLVGGNSVHGVGRSALR
jgi:hypothetical protein